MCHEIRTDNVTIFSFSWKQAIRDDYSSTFSPIAWPSCGILKGSGKKNESMSDTITNIPRGF